jgi:hypothetical protein
MAGVNILSPKWMLFTEAAEAEDGVSWECGSNRVDLLTCMLNCSVGHHVQQVTWIVEAAAVEVDSRCTAHERIVFLRDKMAKGGIRGVTAVAIKRMNIVMSIPSLIIVTAGSQLCALENTTNLFYSCNIGESLFDIAS